MTDTAPTPEAIAAFDAAALAYSQEAGLPIEVAKEQLGNLLKNMSEDPTSTALFFARGELARSGEVTSLAERVAAIEARLDAAGA